MARDPREDPSLLADPGRKPPRKSVPERLLVLGLIASSGALLGRPCREAHDRVFDLAACVGDAPGRCLLWLHGFVALRSFVPPEPSAKAAHDSSDSGGTVVIVICCLEGVIVAVAVVVYDNSAEMIMSCDGCCSYCCCYCYVCDIVHDT